LKLFGVNKVPDLLGELNEAMDIVINFSGLVKILFLHFL
jgi:hypothetical protein